MTEWKRNPKIDLNDLRALKDSERLNNPKLRTFHFLTKKTKLDWINFEANSSTVWIFPFRKPEMDNRYEYTQAHPGMMSLITDRDAKDSLNRINKVCQEYYDIRFQKENKRHFPNDEITKFSFYFAIIGFFLLMARIIYKKYVQAWFPSAYEYTFFVCLAPWSKLISNFRIAYLANAC